jgi:hypothetical protein
MTTPTPADRLALAVCRAGNIFPDTPTCATPCGQCRRISQIYARELATILRERHGSSETADWLDGIGEHQPTEDAPEPEPAGPTSDDLRTMAAEFAARTPEEFALAVLARWGRPTTQPTPVSERPWERDGWCDAQGTCWMWHPINFHYCLCRPDPSVHTHSLPHWVLPLPIPEKTP